MLDTRSAAAELPWPQELVAWARGIAVAWSVVALLVLAYGLVGGLGRGLLGTGLPYWSFALLVYEGMGFAVIAASARAAERRPAVA
jgi:hypothetical protein